jgi:hypothetical protein
MENISTVTELRTAILRLERKTLEQKQSLDDRFHEKVESLKPRNILKKYTGDILSSPLKNGVVNLALAAGTGFVVRKILFRSATGRIAKLLLNLAQMGVSGLIAAKSAKSAKSRELRNHTTY